MPRWAGVWRTSRGAAHVSGGYWCSWCRLQRAAAPPPSASWPPCVTATRGRGHRHCGAAKARGCSKRRRRPPRSSRPPRRAQPGLRSSRRRSTVSAPSSITSPRRVRATRKRRRRRVSPRDSGPCSSTSRPTRGSAGPRRRRRRRHPGLALRTPSWQTHWHVSDARSSSVHDRRRPEPVGTVPDAGVTPRAMTSAEQGAEGLRRRIVRARIGGRSPTIA
jgi:hypothetical protein